MKARLLYLALLAVIVALFAASTTPGAAEVDTYDGYSWFDGR